MTNARKFARAAAVLSLALIAGPAVRAFAEPRAELFHVLPKEAMSDSLLFADDRLWAGVEGYGGGDSPGQHHLLVFDANALATPAVVMLDHAPQFIYSHGSNEVLITGLSVSQDTGHWMSHFSVVNRASANWQVQRHDFPFGGPQGASFPAAIFVNQYTSVGSRAFFSLRYGENGLMQWGPGNTARKMAPRIVMPDDMVALNGNLYVHERDNVDNLVRVDLATEQATRLFAGEKRPHINRIGYWENAGLLAVASDRGLILVDPVSFTVKQVIDVQGTPDGLVPYGRCLVTVTNDTRILNYLAIQNGVAKVGAHLDLSPFGMQFETPRSVAADPARQRLFVRATRACPGCQHTPNGIAVVTDAEGDTQRLCGL